jgi:1-deoxy-D-xylulose-5-phosphate synthase
MGKGEIRRDSKQHRIAILAFGSMLHPALAAAEEIDATVANMRFVKPLDNELVAYLARTHEALVTVEENVVAGGAGSAVAEALAAEGFSVPMLQLGLPDEFIDHGDPALLLSRCGLDAKGIAASIAARFGARRNETTPSATVVKIAKPAA